MPRIRNRLELRVQVQVAKRCFAIDHLVQDTPKRPDVGRAADLHRRPPFTRRLGRPRATISNRLGRHVVQRAYLGIPINIGRVVLDGPRDPKVDELEAALDLRGTTA